MRTSAPANGTTEAAAMAMGSVIGGVRWWLDRVLSIGYGVLYDYIFERFAPYQELKGEVLHLVESGRHGSASPRDTRVLDVGCGTGNFTFALAEAGFNTLGVDPYAALVELAREKRRAQHVTNLAFRHADLAKGNTFREGLFDQVINVHSLYVHAAPQRLLAEAYRILKPGGHAVFVNFTRRVELWPAFRDARDRQGLRAALRCLVWVLPNAIFESTRKRIGPHYWDEDEFSAQLRQAGFTVLALRRTFFNGASLLAWARKDTTA